jgi:hypothetical protein
MRLQDLAYLFLAVLFFGLPVMIFIYYVLIAILRIDE